MSHTVLNDDNFLTHPWHIKSYFELCMINSKIFVVCLMVSYHINWGIAPNWGNISPITYFLCQDICLVHQHHPIHYRRCNSHQRVAGNIYTVSSNVVEHNVERRKFCQCHWQNYIFKQKWSNSPMFLFKFMISRC